MAWSPARRSKEPSEFGGVPGLIAPLPHVVAAEEGVTHEYARLVRATDAADGADTPERALARERAREGRA